MIELAEAARIRCDHPGCDNKQPGRMVLMASGGFAVRPQSMAWQIGLAQNGVFLARCPDHRQAIQGPEGQMLDPNPKPADEAAQ